MGEGGGGRSWEIERKREEIINKHFSQVVKGRILEGQ